MSPAGPTNVPNRGARRPWLAALTAVVSLCAVLDRINSLLGKGVRWLTVAVVLVQFTVVLLRYFFGTSFIVLQETVIYLHAAVFMLGAGFTLLHDGHVRVDVFYGEGSPRRKALIDLGGVLILLVPACVAILWFTWGSVTRSWAILEGPLFVGGIPAVFLLKSLIPAFAILLLLQGTAMALRAGMCLVAGAPYPATRPSE